MKHFAYFLLFVVLLGLCPYNLLAQTAGNYIRNSSTAAKPTLDEQPQ